MKNIGIIGCHDSGKMINCVLDIETQGMDNKPTILIVDDEPKEQQRSTVFDREPLVITISSIDRYADLYLPIKRKGHERDYRFHK